MSVYVDPSMEWPKTSKWPYGSVSRMYADTPEELHEMARRIGLKRQWCSDHTQPNQSLLHYDLTPKRKKAAVAAGAEESEYDHVALYRCRATNKRLVARCKELIAENEELKLKLKESLNEKARRVK